MRKSLLFIAALCATVAVNAKTITLEPGEDKIKDAYATAEAGDVIELTGDADHVYTEWSSITIEKPITLRAAEGATPVVHMPKIKMHAAFEVEGIEFYGFTDYLFITEVGGDFSVSFRNCVLRDNPAYFIYLCENQSINSLKIDGCIFKDNTKNENCVVYGRGTISNFEMRNSTVMNCLGNYAVRVYSGENFVVDHCTFANVGMQALRLAETTKTSTAIAVSNCVIFSETATTDYAYYVYNGTLTNSVYFNSPTPGYRSGLTVNKIINANPQFIDPANGNLNFAFTSPLFLAATDGTHIGDPRWTVEVGDDAIAVPDTLPAMQAVLSGTKISATEDGVKWNSISGAGNYASWTIEVEKAGDYDIVINQSVSGMGHRFIVSIANETAWLDTIEESVNSWASNDINIGTLHFAEAGIYQIRLDNAMSGSSALAKYFIVKYLGGAVVDVPGTLPVTDAILSSGASRVEGYIDFASESNDNARWNIHVPGAIGTKVTIDVKNASGHRYYVYVYDKDDQLVKMVRESSWNTNEGVQELGSVAFPAEGNYYVIVADSSSGSSAVFKDLTFASAGGAVVDIPGTLPVTDAILSSGASVNEAGYIAYASATQDNARWNINATKAGSMSVTMDVAATDGHIYMVALYSMEGDSITAVKEKEWTSASGIMSLVGTIDIPQAGNYYVVVKNTVGGSHATFKDVILAYKGGGVVTIPGTLLPADAMLSEKAFIDNDTIIFAPRGSEGHTHEGWAKWNVRLENDAICAFTAKCYVFNDNGSTFQIMVFNAENEVVYQKSKEIRKLEDIEVEINLESTLLPAGDYVIQMQNTVKDSRGRLMSVVVTAQPIITITDDSDIDFTDYAGQMVTVQLMRTFKANMYNPLCLPFAVSDELFQQIFKSTKSFTLSEASLENQKLFVKLAENYGIYQGTPVMVKPSEDVVNPIFENVEIKTANPSSTTKGPLCLRGSFARHELENKENILLVGANNTLFFPSDEHPYIKSMRAYFELKDIEPSQMPRFAAFVEPGNAPTEMIIVGGKAERQKGHRKVLVDGQIRIQHEGKCYSILGLER